MNILFLTRLYWPHIGGVEQHIRAVSKKLKIKKQRVTILTEKYNKLLKTKEFIDGIKVIRFAYPHTKFVGLLSIWLWLWRNRSLIKQSDIVYCHDVFIWYFPFRFLYPKKVVTTTFHGWGGHYPVHLKEIFLVKIAKLLSWRTIAVGKYIEKWYGIKANYITYGGITQNLNVKTQSYKAKLKNSIVFVGRLEEDTGVIEFLKWLDSQMAKWLKIDFVGDGSLRKRCEKYGIVHGFTDPASFLAKAQYCVPGGYLSCLAAMAHFCKIKVFWNNPLKKDYWRMTPFFKFIRNNDIEGAYGWVKDQTWRSLSGKYLDLWEAISV